MNKEYLEAFKNLKQELYYSPDQLPDIDKWHEAIEQALQRLESIDDANPNEALNGLEYICKILKEKYIVDVKWVFKNDYNIIKQTLMKSQEQEKVLEIIKNIIKFGDDLISILDFETYEEYYKYSDDYGYLLTQEEFESVKEAFKNE